MSVNVVVVGYGSAFGMGHHHSEMIGKATGLELVGVCEPDEERRAAAAATEGPAQAECLLEVARLAERAGRLIDAFTAIRAATRATLVAFPREAFRRILTQHPPVARPVLRDLAVRLRRCTVLIEDLSLRTVPERLARLLLERAREAPETRRMTQQEMAMQLGTVREVVARSLAQFEAQGWIHMERGTIEILDLGALRAIGEPDAT